MSAGGTRALYTEGNRARVGALYRGGEFGVLYLVGREGGEARVVSLYMAGSNNNNNTSLLICNYPLTI